MRIQSRVRKYSPEEREGIEYVEVDAYPKKEYNEFEPLLLWRIDYDEGCAKYYEEGPADLEYNNQDWIKFNGGLEDYLEQRGCKNIEEKPWDEFTFE
jgi:hypothetical protein